MTDERGRLRISNADRDEAIAHLQQALDEGRLDLSEFDSRSKAVYEAKTNAELDIVFDDLPVERGKSLEPAAAEAESAPQEACGHRGRGGRGPFQALIWVGTITTTIWLVSNLADDSPEWGDFWPMYPIGVLLAITLASWITSLFNQD